MKTEYDKLPDDVLRESLRAYIEKGRPTGGFLRAVLANDLMGSEDWGDHEKSLYYRVIREE